ncbi:MAG: hypothetical protein GX665_12390 [Gammaproteobacteria bacterium]|nr:hypothetical protein [Gammaproteobacteria bacterium]
MSAPRPKQHLIQIAKQYPNCWRDVDEMRAGKGKDLPDWPVWCYLPIAGGLAIVSQHESMFDAASKAGVFTGLAAWRVTQGIYRFDPDLYSSLLDTPVTGDIPCSILYQLPEWCVYVETPGGEKTEGFFAYLEYDINTGRHELRLIFDTTAGDLEQVILHLGSWTLETALEKSFAEAKRQLIKNDFSQAAFELNLALGAGELVQHQNSVAERALNFLLFICSQAGEVGTPERGPGNPEPKRTKLGWRIFTAQKTSTWDVGVRIGAELRRSMSSAGTAGSEEAGRTVRPHMRRAHWHGFWTGPRDPDKADQRRYGLKWLPPTPVNISQGSELPAVIRPIKKREN